MYSAEYVQNPWRVWFQDICGTTRDDQLWVLEAITEGV